jgi:hypothetical protein
MTAITPKRATGWLSHWAADRELLEDAEHRVAIQSSALKLYQTNPDFQKLVKEPTALSTSSVRHFYFLSLSRYFHHQKALMHVFCHLKLYFVSAYLLGLV